MTTPVKEPMGAASNSSEIKTPPSAASGKKLRNKKKAKKSAKPRIGFLDLPAEIRNLIYRNLLVTIHATSKVPNPAYLASRLESEPIDNPIQTLDEAIGTVRCQNVWKTQSTFQMAILRVNRQVYKEAYPHLPR